MGIQLNLPAALVIAAGLLLLAIFVFARVRSDYRAKGVLTPVVAWLQIGFFFIYAFSSYLFLDSRITAVSSRGFLLGLALILMIVGLAVVILSMRLLGRKSFGEEIGHLQATGLYRFSRNPQLAGSFIFIIGYVLLWPSWTGFLWASLWLPISYLMIRGEEEHLASVFGKEYEEYWKRTPRCIGFPRDVEEV